MNQQLMEVIDSNDNFETFNKVQYLRIIKSPVNLNDSLAEPFFIKKALDYDKYELPTVLPFQQFDMLFRPLKNSSIFKRFLFWKKMSNLSLFVVVIWLLAFYLTLYFSGNLIITLCIFGALYFLLLGYLWYIGHMLQKFYIELQQYCQTIQHEAVTVQLCNIVDCCQKLYTHFEVRSKIREDGKSMKIYSKLGGEEFIKNRGEQIFKKSDFMFDQHSLSKFVTFEEFQQKIRAFKQNQAYKECVFWRKINNVVFILNILLYFKLFIDQKVMSFLFLLVSVIFSFIILGKRSNCKSKMVKQLRTFCENVSIRDERVQVIVHLRENPKKECCLPVEDQLYCFEIRLKDQIHT